MKLETYIREEQIVISPDSASTKTESLSQLVDVLAQATQINRDVMYQAVLHRESLMSTGIGQGLAVPHVRLEGLSKPVVAMGIYPGGVSDYVSLDADPIRIILLIAAPKGQHDTYIRLLAAAVDVLKNPETRQAILSARTADEIVNLLKEEQK